MSPAVDVRNLRHRYGDHTALDDVTFTVECGELFGLLGPNGGGKTTLFRILCTLLPVQEGEVRVLDRDATTAADAVRHRIGVTFQSPSLDVKLTVRENLRHQAHLYGLVGRLAGERIDDLLHRLGLADRERDRVESLSGGLRRRVEIAKGLLHDPELLLLDEPSTGLDPGARHDLWIYLERLRTERGVTVLVTTHLMDEAERCDRLGILDRGRLVALDAPERLRASVGGDCVTIATDEPESLAASIRDRFRLEPRRMGETLRLEREDGLALLQSVVETFGERISSITLGRPTLEDVFIDRTGHRFWEDGAGDR